jgi:hypothetical protein
MIILLLHSVFAAKVFQVPSSSDLNMARFPPMDAVVPVNREFVAKYDLSKVPNISLTNPRQALGPPTCNSTDIAVNGCNWSCSTQCLRPTDINGCDGAGKLVWIYL